MKIAIVSGALANKPRNGGNAWTRMQWVLGLRRLGFRVYFVEQINSDTCVDEQGTPVGFETSVNRSFFEQTCRRFKLLDSACLICDGGTWVDGISLPELTDAAKEADLLINISGHLTLEKIKMAPRHRVYFDDDPGYTQFWHVSGHQAARLAEHDSYFTVGANIGQPECLIPCAGISWRALGPIVVLDEWPEQAPDERRAFTTIASWRGAYGPVEFGQQKFGQKVHEFRKFVELPQRTRQPFEVALSIDPVEKADIQLLEEFGWRLTNPAAAATTNSYRGYIQGSGAEFSVAQGIYVQTNSGWFSDRTACYLASGRPALVQDTGFSRNIPAKDGLLSFRTLDEAIEGAEQIAGNYARHSHAARRIAERYFDSDRVLGRMLDEVGTALP